MTLTRNHMIGLVVAALTLLADQASKWVMMGPLNLPETLQIYILPIFNFTFTENHGVSLGLLTADSASQRWLLIAMTGVIAAVVAVWMTREKWLGDIVPLGLVLGGALGNIWDRVTLGYVVDFADLHFGSFRPFLIFNLADAAITLGVLIILARSFLSREKRETKIEPAETAPES